MGGGDGNRHSSQETSQNRTRGRGVAPVAVNSYNRPQGMGGDTCIGCKRGPRCRHIGIESPLSYCQRCQFDTQNEHSWAYEWSTRPGISRRSALPEGGIPESRTLQLGRTQGSEKKSGAFANFAYLLGIRVSWPRPPFTGHLNMAQSRFR